MSSHVPKVGDPSAQSNRYNYLIMQIFSFLTSPHVRSSSIYSKLSLVVLVVALIQVLACPSPKTKVGNIEGVTELNPPGAVVHVYYPGRPL